MPLAPLGSARLVASDKLFRHKGLYVSATKKGFQYGDHTVTIETGELARQADGAVLVTMSETVVLVTAVGLKKATPGPAFFPLTVNYQEQTYAASRVPGGFFKLPAPPPHNEPPTSRLI